MNKFRVTVDYFTRYRDVVGALGSGYALMVLTVAIQLVLVPLFLNHLGKEMFGILTMILAAINYGAIGITWLSGGMARILGEHHAMNDSEGFSDAYALSKVVYVGYAVFAIGIFWLVFPLVVGDILNKPELLFAIVLACIYFLVMYEYNTDRLALVAQCRQTIANLVDAGGQVVFACGVLVGLYLGGGLAAVIAAQTVGIFTARATVWLYWRRHGNKLSWKWPLPDVGPMRKRIVGKMGQHYVVYGALILTLQADVLIIGLLGGPQMAATFYLLWRIPEVCILLLSRIPSVFSPYLIQMDTRGEADQIQKTYRHGLLVMLGLSAAAGLGYATFGNTLVHLWVGDDAPTGYLPYALAGTALFFVAVSWWPSGVAYAMVKTSALIKVTALQLAIKLLLIALLFSETNYLAPLIAIVATHLSGVFLLYLRLGRIACDAPQSFATQN